LAGLTAIKGAINVDPSGSVNFPRYSNVVEQVVSQVHSRTEIKTKSVIPELCPAKMAWHLRKAEPVWRPSNGQQIFTVNISAVPLRKDKTVSASR
jgi:hypothetical protein